METKDIVTTAVTSIIALGGWLFAWLRERENQKQKQLDEQHHRRRTRVDKVLAQLDAYAALTELYRLLARSREYIVQTDDGQLAVDSEGKFIARKEFAKPEPSFESAIQSLQGSDIRSAIAQKIVQLRLASGEVGDILHQLEPSGKLNKELATLHHKTV